MLNCVRAHDTISVVNQMQSETKRHKTKQKIYFAFAFVNISIINSIADMPVYTHWYACAFSIIRSVG